MSSTINALGAAAIAVALGAVSGCSASSTPPKNDYFNHTISVGAWELLSHKNKDGSLCYLLLQKPAPVDVVRTGGTRSCTDTLVPTISLSPPLSADGQLALGGVVSSGVAQLVITSGGNQQVVKPTDQAFLAALPPGRYLITAMDGNGNVVDRVDTGTLPAAPMPTAPAS